MRERETGKSQFRFYQLNDWDHGKIYSMIRSRAFQEVLVVKNLPGDTGDMRRRFDPWVVKIPWRRKQHILAWRIPRTEEPGRLQSMGSQRVGHDLTTKQQHRSRVVEFLSQERCQVIKPRSHSWYMAPKQKQPSETQKSTCNEGDLGSIPGLGRSPGEGNGYPLQYSGLENSIDCIVYGVTNSQTRLSDFHFTSLQSHRDQVSNLGSFTSQQCLSHGFPQTMTPLPYAQGCLPPPTTGEGSSVPAGQ